jgi:LacI family transcriptional regulator
MPKQRTIKDIAEQLNVSTSLVSFVLTGKSKEKRISEEMTRKVFEVAKSMNYKPNYLARGLRTGRADTIALIVADISNPFFARFARFLEIEASKFGYRFIIGNSDEEKEKFAMELDILKNGQTDGFILFPPIGSEKELRELNKQKIPYVVMDRVFNGVQSHSVIINNYQAGFEATIKLLKNKRKKIAVLNVNQQLVTMQERVKGYKAALQQNGIEVLPSLIKNLKFSHEKKRIMKAISELIVEGVDGILFTTSKLGVLGIECLKELKVAIPDQIAVISFDDLDAYKVAYTSISAVVQPIEQMSKDAIRILLNMINGKYGDGEYENIKHDVGFILRESTL